MAKKDKPGKNSAGQPQPTGPAPFWDGEKWVLPEQQQPAQPTPPPSGPAPFWDGEKWVLPQPTQETQPIDPVKSAAAPVAVPPEESRRETVYVAVKRKGVKGLVAILVLQCVILLVGLAALALVLFNIQLPIPSVGPIAGGGESQEVSLEAAASNGTAPFSETAFAGTVDEAVAQPATAEPPTDGVTLTVQPFTGDTPLLYGNNDVPVEELCNRDGIAEFLSADPEKAVVWADALNTDPTFTWDGAAVTAGNASDIVTGMARLVLIQDTRVTLHRFDPDGAMPVAAVLQKGTAVLVDRAGVPRVKCNGATPLTAAEQLDGSAKFVGAAWPDLDAAALVEVVPGENLVPSFDVLVPATSDGAMSAFGAPWYEAPAAPTTGFDCLGNGGGGQVTSISLTNDFDQPVALFDINSADDGACTVNFIRTFVPGGVTAFPQRGDATTWTPYENQGFLALPMDGGDVLWSQHVTPAEVGTDVEWSIQ